MNIKELEKLRVIRDDYNNCWAITNEEETVADCDIEINLEFKKDEYLNLLIHNGGYYLSKYKRCVGFEAKEIAEQCLQAIKNYKENDIIEKVSDNLFTEKELEILQQFKKKAYTMVDKRREFDNKYGKLMGNVFDGGFYTLIDSEKVSKNELEEYKKLVNQLDILNKIFI